MRITRLLCFVLACCFLSLNESSAQATLIEGDGAENPFKVNLLPPSPEAAALAKYADIPVSLYSGTPEIAIPLYEIKERELTLPISVSYHASGHKVGDQASRVGLGWALNAGGVVTRTVRGWPDEYTAKGFLSTVQQYDLEDFALDVPPDELYQRYDAMADNCLDTEPDIFYFNFAGYSGTFTFDWDGQIEIESPSNFKITPLGMNPGQSDFIDGFEIVAEDGTVFLFNVTEGTSHTFTSSPSCDLALNNEMISTWYLKEMRTPDGVAWIRFEYEPYTQEVESWAAETKVHNWSASEASGHLSRQKITTTISGKQLKSITTSSGQVKVDLSNGDLRTDLAGGTSYMLGKVQVKNSKNKIIKDYRFTQDYSTGRLTLKKITEWSPSGLSSMSPWEFNYYGGVLPDPLSFNQDHWGFVGQNTAQTLIPATIVPIWGGTSQLSGANRNPSSTGALTGVLREIIYPTGGKDIMDFELHDYEGGLITSVERLIRVLSNVWVPKTVIPGQLEIAQSDFIASDKNYYISGSATFGYSSGLGGGSLAGVSLTLKEKVSGNVIFYWAPGGTVDQNGEPERKYIEQAVLVTPGIEYSLIATARVPLNSDDGINSISGDIRWFENVTTTVPFSNQGGGLRIRKMTRSFGNGTRDKITKYNYRIVENGVEKSSGALSGNVFKYEEWLLTWSSTINEEETPRATQEQKFYRYGQNRCPLGSTKGSHVGYRQVIVLYGENGENGKTIYKYTSPHDFADYLELEVPYPPAWSVDYKRGLLLEQEDYDSGGIQVRKVINEYSYHDKEIDAIKVGWREPGWGPTGGGFLSRYAVSFYKNFLGYSRLKQTSEKTFFKDRSGDTHTFENTKKFTYNEDTGHRQLISTVTTDSEQDSLFTWMIYPQDYPPGDVALDLMKNKHIVNRVVETINWKKSGNQKFLLSATKTDFSVNFGKALPSVIKGAKIREPFPITDPVAASLFYEPRLQYLNYGQLGNPLEHALTDGQRTSYIWDEWGTLVFAKVDNAKSDQIYYTSFEEITSGVSYTYKKTGSRSKIINNTTYTLSFKTPLPVGQYILSYWLKGINDADPWTYVESVVDITQPVYSFTTRVLNGYLDEVRLHPVGALMTTFTHEPLVGITSITNPNNVTVYFEFDEFNRLKCKRDQDNNILECYDYQYQQDVSFTSSHAPTISSFNPAFGTGGTEITIHGNNFSATSTENIVKFNGVAASVLSSTATELKVTVPEEVTTGKVSITVNGLEFTSDIDFTVPPVITSFTPASGLPTTNSGFPGTTITIIGTGFSTVPSENTIRFNGTVAEITQASSTQLSVMVPLYAASGKISITRNGVTTESQNNFTVLPRNVWQQTTDFANGLRRTNAAGFAIGTKIYLGTGKNENDQQMSDFWELDTETNVWTKKADFPGLSRVGAVGFSIGTKGYIGSGLNTNTDLADFWEYDPATDTWKQIADFKGLARSGAVAFTLGTKGYVGTGSNSVNGALADVWEYDPLLNDWRQIQGLPAARTDAYAFVIGSKAYVGGGRNKAFYQYDAVSNTWSRKADCPYYAGMAAFTVGSKGYVQGLKELWMYDANSNQWISKASLPISITYSKGFATGTAGYVGTGLEGSVKTKVFFKYIPE